MIPSGATLLTDGRSRPRRAERSEARADPGVRRARAADRAADRARAADDALGGRRPRHRLAAPHDLLCRGRRALRAQPPSSFPRQRHPARNRAGRQEEKARRVSLALVIVRRSIEVQSEKEATMCYEYEWEYMQQRA